MNHRVYGKKISLSPQEVKSFWERRASMFDEKGISAVICGDQNAERALKENAFDREHILPRLGLTPASRVFDMGCGVGRVAEMILPQCGFYCGVDYSEEMLQVTQRVCQQVNSNIPSSGNYALHHMSLTEMVDKTPEFFGGPFDIFIMMSVCMYINDEDLEYAFRRIPGLMSPRATILFQESVGLEERLTLDGITSEALQTSYSAIYRTREEYMQLYQPLFDAGFEIDEEAKFPDFGNAYADSERRFCIMKRGTDCERRTESIHG